MSGSLQLNIKRAPQKSVLVSFCVDRGTFFIPIMLSVKGSKFIVIQKPYPSYNGDSIGMSPWEEIEYVHPNLLYDAPLMKYGKRLPNHLVWIHREMISIHKPLTNKEALSVLRVTPDLQ